MSRFGVSVIVLVSLVVLVLLGAVASQVGGVPLRTSGQMYEVGRMTVKNNAILPGAPVRISVELGKAATVGASSIVLLRAPEESITLGEVMKKEVDSGEIQIVVSCTGVGEAYSRSKVRLILVDSVSQAVLAQSELLTVLSPGPDCLFE